MSEHPLFASKFDNHIFYDLSPFSLAGMKNGCMGNDACMQIGNLAQRYCSKKSLFIDFKRLHIVQHIIIVSIKSLHLLVVDLHFLDEVQQLLSIPSDRDETLAECFRFIKHFMSFTNGLVDLLDGLLDVELSG